MKRRFLCFWLISFLLIGAIFAQSNEKTPDALNQEGNQLKKDGLLTQALSKYQESQRLAIESNDQTAVANSWIAVADVKRALGDYKGALPALENARKIGEALQDKRLQCAVLILSARLDNNQNHYDQAQEKSTSAQQFAEELQDNVLLANALTVRAEALMFQGKLEEALPHLKTALSLAEQSGDAETLCPTLDKLGELHRKLGLLAEAIQYHERAVRTSEENGLKLLLPTALNGLAVARNDQGLTEEAALTYLRALNAAEAVGDKLASAKILNNLGIIYWEKGSYDKATTYLHRASRLAEELGNRYGMAKVLHNLGMVYAMQGMHEKALSYYQRALKIRQALGAKDELPAALNSIAEVYADQNKIGEAISCLKRALAIATEVGDKLRIANSALGLGRIYSDHGSPQKAALYFKKSLTIATEINFKKGMTLALHGLGKLYLSRLDFPASEDAFQRSLVLAQEIQAPRLIAKSESGLARTYTEMGNSRRAIGLYATAIDQVEKIRVSATSEEGKAAIVSDQLQLYEEQIALLFKSGEQKLAAFDYSERARARALLDSLTEARSGVRKGLNDEQFLQEHAIFKKISTIQSQLSQANPAESDLPTLKTELRKTEDELESFLLDLRLNNPEYARLQYPDPDHVADIQSALDPDTVLVEFFLGQKQSFVFAVSNNAFQMEALPARQKLEQEISSYRALAGKSLKATGDQDGTRLFAQYHRQAQILFTRLVAPIRNSLKEKTRILFVLDGILHYIPFEALEDPTQPVDGGRGRYLLEDHVISYVPSATIWRSLLQAAPSTPYKKELLAFGDPVFQDRGAIKPSRSEQSESDQLRGLYELRGFNFHALPYSRLEVERIGELFPIQSRQLYLGERATESLLKKEKLEKYRDIHFATHAVIDEDVPGRSGVLLSSPDPDEDGMLQVHEIFNLELNADMVILSACQTALGKLVYGEGMVGLMRAFLYAGARNIVVSLWNVDDKSTADLMATFYKSMQSGKDKTSALREAKLELLHSAEAGTQYPAYAYPYYWAAFTLVGSGK